MLLIAISSPFSVSITSGRFFIIPNAKMATSGWLIIGVPMTLPKVPTLEIVKVLPLISSPANLFSLAFPANSFTLAAMFLNL